MDDLFGNSSSETIVSKEDLQNETDYFCNQDDNIENNGLQTIANKESNLSSHCEGSRSFNQVSVIRSLDVLGNIQNQDIVFKIPATPSVLLKHAKSVIASHSPKTVSPRARAHSTSVSPNLSGNAFKHHPYQNVPYPIGLYSRGTSPSYVNLPKICVNRPQTTDKNANVLQSIPDANKSVNPRFHGSYIQLWNGVKKKVKSNNEEDSHKISENGYVSMSSPLVRSPNSSVLSELANQLSSANNVMITKDIFCPFCPRPFTLEQNLKHHIQAIHRHELQRIVNQNEPILIQYCPLCHGRFLNMDLLPSHLLEFHRGSLIDILNHYENIRVNENEIKCPFCIKKIASSVLGEDLLLYHILQIHCEQYDEIIRKNFKPIHCHKNKESLSKLSTENLAHALSFKPQLTSTPGLSLKFKSLSCETDISDFEETWNSHCKKRTENVIPRYNNFNSEGVSKGILRSQADLSRRPSVKRELRFSVPPVTSEEFFIPESPESSLQSPRLEVEEQDENLYPIANRQNIPVRVDSLCSADFIELNHVPSRKRRRLSLKSKKSSKKKKKDTIVDNVFEGLKSIGCPKSQKQPIVRTEATKTFRKPKTMEVPSLSSSSPATLRPIRVSLPTKRRLDSNSDASSEESTEGSNSSEESLESSPFENMKLFSPVRMFRCNSCRMKYCDNDSLSSHIKSRHRGILGILRPQFGCGICSSKFYENKYLVKHCLQHHTSLLEIRSPKKRKITIYRFTEN